MSKQRENGLNANGSSSTTQKLMGNKKEQFQEMLDCQLILQVDVSFDVHYEFLKRYGLEDAHNVLDIGTGNGYFLSKIATKHPKIFFIGLESMPSIIDKARENLKLIPNAKIILADILDNSLITKVNTFDFIFMRYTAFHIKQIEKALAIVHYLLKPNGRLLIIDVETDLMQSNPYNAVFELYKKSLNKLYHELNYDCHMGSKLPYLLKKAGFNVITSEVSLMSNRDIGNDNFQKYILHGAKIINFAEPDCINDEEYEQINKFVTNIISEPNFYAAYGHMMIVAERIY